MTLSGFGGRQSLYERFFFGDPLRMRQALYTVYDRSAYVERVHRFVAASGEVSAAGLRSLNEFIFLPTIIPGPLFSTAFSHLCQLSANHDAVHSVGSSISTPRPR